MTLQGTLRNFSASQLLNLIYTARKSGTLTLFGTDQVDPDASQSALTTTGAMLRRARIVFKDGLPVMSDVEMRNLVALLRRAGKLSPTQAEWLEQRVGQANEKAQALLMIEANFATRDEIMALYEQQLRDDIHNILMWVDGSFIFEEDMPDLDEHITVPIDLQDVLVQHGAHVREVKRMTQEIPTLSATVRFTRDVDERLQRTRLSAKAWRVISSVKDGVTIRHIARVNDMDAMEVRRVVISLIQAGVLELGEPVSEVEENFSELETEPEEDARPDPTILDTLIDGIQTAAEKLIDEDTSSR
ncbi:MAG: hypothetical protein Kow0077_02750 [Anaerolineae bacterium]